MPVEAIANLMRRTLIRTKAPILSTSMRIVPEVAAANLSMREGDAPRYTYHQHVSHCLKAYGITAIGALLPDV